MATFRKLFEIDYRALAVFRIGIGLMLIVDLVGRAFDLTAFYTDTGVLPRVQLVAPVWVDGMFSFHTWGGSSLYEGFLFLLAFLLALLVVVGWRTRWVLFLSWVFLISLHNRNVIILNGGDHLLRAFLFWSLFLPVGRRFSLDALRNKVASKEKNHCSAATFVLLMQMVVLYEVAGLSKLHPYWLKEGSAVFYALASEQMTKPLGLMLLSFPALLKALTFGTMFLEIVLPVLAFIPRKTDIVRLVLVPVFWAFHLGLFLTLDLGLFPCVCMLGWVPYLPSRFWDWLEATRIVQACSARCSGLFPSVGRKKVKPRRAPAWPAMIGHVVVLCFFLYVVLWNVKTFKPAFRGAIPAPLLPMGYVLRLDQRWQLFSPHPSTDLAWHVFVGTLSDGTQVDLLDGEGPVLWDKPEHIRPIYGGFRWRQYFKLFLSQEYAGHRPLYCEYLCRTWNQPGGTPRLENIELYYIKAPLFVDQPSPPFERFLVWAHDCNVPAARP